MFRFIGSSPDKFEIFLAFGLLSIKETLIDSSFRAKRSGDPESRCLFSICYWIPACAGMTEYELIRPFLTFYTKSSGIVIISECASIRLIKQMLLMLFSENMEAKEASIIKPGLSVKLVELDDLYRVASPTCSIARFVEL